MASPLLEVDPGVSVTLRSTTPRTVAFFSRHATESGELGVLAVHILDTVVDAMSRSNDIITDSGRRSESESAIIESLRALETRLVREVHSQGERLDRVRDQVAAIGADVQVRLLDLIVSVQRAVHDGVERLNADNIAQSVSETVRGWLQDSRTELSHLSVELKSELARAVVDPVMRQSEQLSAFLSALPPQVSALLASRDQEVSQRLQELKSHLDAQQLHVAQLRADVTARTDGILAEVLRSFGESRERLSEQRADVPRVVKAIVSDALRDLETQTSQVRAAVAGAQQELVVLSREIGDGKVMKEVLRSRTEDALLKLDALSQQLMASQLVSSQQRYSQKVKGQQGEAKLFELLSDRLTSREGYEVELVNGTSHACDISVKRLGHPEVRIENKAHGQGTNEKVRAKEVARFCSDMLGLQCHGVFVSQHAGIVGKGAIEVELLPNGRVAVFLSNCEYNVDIIYDMLQVIYRLDKIIGDRDSSEGNGGALRVTAEAMQRVTQYLKDFTTKVTTAKTHLRESLTLLSELTFDMIERVLMGSTLTHGVESPAPTSVHACPDCGQEFGTKQGLSLHRSRRHNV